MIPLDASALGTATKTGMERPCSDAFGSERPSDLGLKRRVVHQAAGDVALRSLAEAAGFLHALRAAFEQYFFRPRRGDSFERSGGGSN